MTEQPHLKAVELFAGGGSVHLALSRVGVSVVYANDFDPAKRAAYTANFPDTRLDGRSIEDVQPHELPHADILHASSPCKDHSGQGEQAGFEHGERGRMAFHAMRLLRGMSTLNRNPKVVVFENVCGLLHRKMLGDFALFLGGLVSEG
jgi:DNA (cytosine-5)-methyltransferase 1